MSLHLLSVDFETEQIQVEDGGAVKTLPFADPRAFELVSRAWLRLGWDHKYVYSFSWLGRPIIQLPEDMIRIQEVVYEHEPDVLVETGIAHGGSLVFYASLFRAMGKGRVIGIDVDIRSHNREALEKHELFDLITLVEGSSTDLSVLEQVKSKIGTHETVMVVLDSNHTKAHVLDELRAYGPLVSPGFYLVAADGIMKEVRGAPRTSADWEWNNPYAAVQEFLQETKDFVVDLHPPVPFNEGSTEMTPTYWPGGWLKRLREPF